ncbi:MAG: endonuclease MutS2, partial [Clostridia bacterium]|nr:endonuclease MutS2 [Clostridia bacterium]
YAVLNDTKEQILSFVPLTVLNDVENLLNKTEEAFKYLYTYSIGGIYYFDSVLDELSRVDKGGVLNNAELLKVASNLRSARTVKTAVSSVNDDKLTLIKEITNRLFSNLDFEKEIADKILSEDEISDNASPKLYSIRKSIRTINARIRSQLNSYMRGGMSKYLQDGVVTMRQDRYVIPVKSEYRSAVKGFIHDQSSSGATVFIEPEQVMELNNDLKKALFDESEEIYRILAELSSKVSLMSDAIRYNTENLIELDGYFARAEYSFKNKCSRPKLNDKGIINIRRGRHPLIDDKVVIPISLNLGNDYNFLLVTGPNTGGKTVTLKLCGLFALMTMSGLFIPADDSEISVFNNVFCDIGDEQSIEQNLSTFSSHIKNIINIINSVDEKSLVLIDEIGAGTDPEEGSALALAIIEKLLERNCFGIITTHYSRLKEFAMQNSKIENASMEFDAQTLRPLYKLNIGIPGSSNAIDIAKTLGLDTRVIEKAFSFMSDKQISFEKVLKKAEESRRLSDKLSAELELIKANKEQELANILAEKERLIKEREKIYTTAKAETKRIVAEKLAEAEEIIDELKKILKTANLESKELFRAGELRNRLKNSKYLNIEDEDKPYELIQSKPVELKVGNRVYVKTLGAYAKLFAVYHNKKEAVVLLGDIKTVVKFNDLYNSEPIKEEKKAVKVYKHTTFSSKPATELNVVGKDSIEALEDLKYFIDQAIVNGIEEIKVIHGVGQGILLKEIRNYLKNDKNVIEFRNGKYGEGENGVTIIRLK